MVAYLDLGQHCPYVRGYRFLRLQGLADGLAEGGLIVGVLRIGDDVRQCFRDLFVGLSVTEDLLEDTAAEIHRRTGGLVLGLGQDRTAVRPAAAVTYGIVSDASCASSADTTSPRQTIIGAHIATERHQSMVGR